MSTAWVDSARSLASASSAYAAKTTTIPTIIARTFIDGGAEVPPNFVFARSGLERRD
jgi:hypothetical protein